MSQGDVKRGLDYYGVLGITKSATDAEIKEAYQRLATQYNPQRIKSPNTDLYCLFTLIGEAYEVLSNPLVKCIYDQYGEAGLKKGVLTILGWHPPWVYHGDPFQTFKNFFGTSNPYADVIYCMHETINFKNSRVNEVKEKQPPIERDLELTLEEVYFGTLKKLKIQRRVFDNEQVTTSTQEKLLNIRIRPGLPAGTKITFKEVGDEGPNIIPGDLIITTRDIPHKRFKREGNNLCVNLVMEFQRAIGDVTVEVTTIDCRVIRFAITDVITTGYQKVIKGEGMPLVDNKMKKGDLIVTFEVIMPKYLSETARKKMIEAIVSSGSPEEMESPEVMSMIMMATRVSRLKNFKLKDTKEEDNIKENENKDKVNTCEDFVKLHNTKEDIFRI